MWAERGVAGGRRGGRPYPFLIARATGQPLRDVLALSRRERLAWELHFDRYPWGDYPVQSLLAQLTQFFYTANTGKEARRLDVYDLAPQFLSREERLKRFDQWDAEAAAREKAERQMKKEALEAAWDRTKKMREEGLLE